jgi:hypothetical protein
MQTQQVATPRVVTMPGCYPSELHNFQIVAPTTTTSPSVQTPVGTKQASTNPLTLFAKTAVKKYKEAASKGHEPEEDDTAALLKVIASLQKDVDDKKHKKETLGGGS